jgi:hypothetical protein
MAWRAFQSKHLNAGDYDPESRVLTIQFVNGAVYNYYDVPQTTADILFQTGSSQEYFNDHIKGVYQYMKVADGMSQRTGRRSRSGRF